MPWTVAHPAAPGGRAPGQNAGWLGKAFDPFRVEGDPNDPGFQVEGLALPAGVDPDRFARPPRTAGRFRTASPSLRPPGWDAFQARALDALASARARAAFDIDKEPPHLRDKYGRHIHGQCLLLARRLVEFGVPLVTVNWHDDGQNFWDTHGENFHHLKNRLMPPADQGFAALARRPGGSQACSTRRWSSGWASSAAPRERPTAAPAASTGRGATRRRWPAAASQGGQVYGASDRWAAYPARDPVSPDDLGATILHALGIDPHSSSETPWAEPFPSTWASRSRPCSAELDQLLAIAFARPGVRLATGVPVCTVNLLLPPDSRLEFSMPRREMSDVAFEFPAVTRCTAVQDHCPCSRPPRCRG